MKGITNMEFDKMISNLNLLDETELETLSDACLTKIEDTKKARRETLRQTLMSNLQQTIDTILCNGFTLMVENVDNPNWAVQLLPDEIYHIEIK